MKNRLNKAEAEAIRERFTENPYFVFLSGFCKEYEAKLPDIRLRTEEVFQETIAFLDLLKRNETKGIENPCSLWNELLCEIRDTTEEYYPDRSIDAEQLKEATCVIMTSIAIALTLTQNGEWAGVCRSLLAKISQEWPDNPVMATFQNNLCCEEFDEIEKCIKDYVECTLCLTDKDGLLEKSNGKAHTKSDHVEDAISGSDYKWIAGNDIKTQKSNVEKIRAYIKERIEEYPRNKKGTLKKGYKTDIILDVRGRFYATDNSKDKIILRKPDVARYNRLFGDVMAVSEIILRKWEWLVTS